MVTEQEAKARIKEWASTLIPESLHFSEVKCIAFQYDGVYRAVLYNPDTLKCCCSGMPAPNEKCEYVGPIIPHISMETGELVYIDVVCA